MLKYFKEYLSDYNNSEWLQTIVLFASILFFLGIIYFVLKRPKSYYDETSHLPLEEDNENDQLKF